MTAMAPLRVLLIRRLGGEDVGAFEDAFVRAFQGGKDAGAYVASGADIGMQLGIFADTPSAPAIEYLDSFCHTLVLVLVDEELLKADAELFEWVASCFAHVTASDRHKMLVLATE